MVFFFQQGTLPGLSLAVYSISLDCRNAIRFAINASARKQS